MNIDRHIFIYVYGYGINNKLVNGILLTGYELKLCHMHLTHNDVAWNLSSGALLSPEWRKFEAEGRQRGGVLAVLIGGAMSPIASS